MYLGDMGADVIKVENPRVPDFTRLMGARLSKGDNSESGLFLMLNRNKRAITLNLKREEGRAVLLRLLETADILLEGFRPDALSEMGIGYEQLKERFPRLIYCAISGYGASGPYTRLAGHDGNYIGYAGLLDITGPADGPPELPGFQVADIGGGALIALSGILAAVYARQKSGRGQFVDVSMLDGAFSFLSLHAGEFLASGQPPQRGRMTLSGALPNYNVYRCRDGKYVILAALEERFFRAFLRQIGEEALLEGLRLDAEGLAVLFPRLRAIFAQRDRDQWQELFLNSECCLGPVNSVAEAFADPQLRSRQMVVEIEHPQLGPVLMIGAPFHFSDTPVSYRQAPPGHGQHTDEVLESLGIDASRRAELRSRRAI